jgi:hypothetical protein
MPLRSGHRLPTPPPSTTTGAPPWRVKPPATCTGRAMTSATGTTTRPSPRPPLPSSHPLLTAHWPTGLHTGAPTHTPPLPRVDTAAGNPCHLGITNGRRYRPSIRASRLPHRSSDGRRPHYRAVLLGCRRGVHCPHCPHTANFILKAREEATTPTAPSSIKF